MLNEAGVPCGPIYAIDEMFDDPQVRHLGIVTPIDHPVCGPISLVSQAATLSRTPSRIHSATPEIGQHTDAILSELGLDATTITGLHERRVV